MYAKEVINEIIKVDWTIKGEKPKTDYTSCLIAKIMDASNAINEYSIRKKANYVIVNRKIAHLINVFRKLDGDKLIGKIKFVDKELNAICKKNRADSIFTKHFV